MNGHKILLVEDDREISEMMRNYLMTENYDVVCAFDGQEACRLFAEGGFGLVLLDLMIPKMSGMEVMQQIRRGSYVPIIILSAKDTETDKTLGLMLGADDYMVKPFSPAELVARVRSHIMIHQRLLERKEGRKPTQLLMGNLKILPEERRVFLGEEEIALANKEFELLLLMAQNPNIAFSKETLFNRIWGMDSVGATDTVTVHINRLRQKLERNSASPRMIETVWGVGYRFKINI